jgi:four helix bundle protein
VFPSPWSLVAGLLLGASFPGRRLPLGVGNFEALDTYRAAVALADELHAAVSRWPSFDRWAMGMQLLRAIDSIGANLAEGSGRWHLADERRFLYFARGSLHESQHWIARAVARKLLLPTDATKALDELGRALNGQIKASLKATRD